MIEHETTKTITLQNPGNTCHIFQAKYSLQDLQKKELELFYTTPNGQPREDNLMYSELVRDLREIATAIETDFTQGGLAL